MPDQDINFTSRLLIGDLKVLSDKCKRDVDRKYPFNYEYYLEELNRIIVKLKTNDIKEVEDVDIIKDAAIKSMNSGSMTGEQDAKLREIDAVAEKLLVRLSANIQENIQPITILENMFNRFHQVAKQLRTRHDSRATIDLKDEYDVQDLLQVLLKLYFNDIRTEEWTPSYAGSSSRMDFLLKNEGLVIEVKKTRDKLRDREIGEQLLIDISKYKEHLDYKTLVCFIYDPEGFVSNPTGLENDLNKTSNDKLVVRAFVAPK